jgi:predicted small metal-binding protein
VSCDCGWVFEGAEHAELVAAVREHGQTRHGTDVTADQALAMAQSA